MKLWNRKGKILRLRPGPLANFSGGSGYMPLMWILNGPVSLIFGLIAYIMLGRKARPASKPDSDPEMRKAALFEFVAYSRKFYTTCLAIAAIAGVYFIFMGWDMIYATEKGPYLPAMLILALGPFAAWILATRFLIRRLEKGRPLWQTFATAVAGHIGLVVVSIILGIMVMIALEPKY